MERATLFIIKDGRKSSAYYSNTLADFCRWDEAVMEESLVRIDEEGLALQESLRKRHGSMDPTDPAAISDIAKSPGFGPYKAGKMIIPEEITDILGKDWDFVNRRHLLQLLPASITANDVLVEFRKVYRKKKIVGLGVFDQFTMGLKNALDSYIGRGLLYRFERLQLKQTMEANRNTPLSEIYGPVVLARYLGILNLWPYLF